MKSERAVWLGYQRRSQLPDIWRIPPMSSFGSGGGGAFPALQRLARLQAQRGAAPSARGPDDWARMARESQARRVHNAQLARAIVPPPLVPADVRAPPMRIPIPPGMQTTLLPPPLSPIATAGWLAGVLSGPQKAEFRRDGSPPPPGSGAGRRGRRRDFRQCDIQMDNDQEICRAIPEGASRRRARCWESMEERYAYCTANDGEVGFPPLRSR